MATTATGKKRGRPTNAELAARRAKELGLETPATKEQEKVKKPRRDFSEPKPAVKRASDAVDLAYAGTEIGEMIKQISQLTGKALKNQIFGFNRREIRYLVQMYYKCQKDRIRCDAQARLLNDLEKVPEDQNCLISFFAQQAKVSETVIKGALDYFTLRDPIGSKLRKIYGIGPVTAAGLLAHIDITKAKTAGAVWRFAGLDPTLVWEAGKERPWNANFKKVCWFIGQSFKKFYKNPNCYYGKLYAERKQYEIKKNEEGGNAEYCKTHIQFYGKDTDAYKYMLQGKLSPGHLDSRATRWTVQIFLSHVHAFMYEQHFHEPAPVPFAIAHLNHVHIIESPFCNEMLQSRPMDDPEFVEPENLDEQ